MGSLSALTFANPLALAALAVLPLIWWLLRYTPPRPETVKFAPFRLLLDLVAREEDTDKTPWWLVALRLAIAGLVILAVARPLLSEDVLELSSRNPVLIVMDDGWASGGNWDQMMGSVEGLIAAAKRKGAPVSIATSVGEVRPTELAAVSPEKATERALAILPRSITPSRATLLSRLKNEFSDQDGLSVFWLSDGIDHGGAMEFAKGLSELAQGNALVKMISLDESELGPRIGLPELEKGKLKIAALRAAGAKIKDVSVQLVARNGRSLAEKQLVFSEGKTRTQGEIELPLAMRNEAAQIRIAGQRSAGAVFLLDDRWQRKTVVQLSGASFELEQPLLSPLYYVSRALEPSAQIFQTKMVSELLEHIESGVSLAVLADVGKLRTNELEALDEWIERGGVLVRFAGPRLASGSDGLVPVGLRTGGRSLGSALSWEQPQRMAPFAEDSPFEGLGGDPTVLVTRQVLAEPSGSLLERTWASLEDGTPLITAQKRGAGLLVLFHVTANGDWSNLPFSGLFVELLRRILDLAPGVGAESGAGAAAANVGGTYAPQQILNGFGALSIPTGEVTPVLAGEIANAIPSATHPAGLYKKGQSIRAINLALPGDGLKAIGKLPSDIAVGHYQVSRPVAFTGLLLGLALGLFLLDCIAALALSGALRRLRYGSVTSAAIALCLVAGNPEPLYAQSASGDNATLSSQDRFALSAALDTRLAYVTTGRKSIDDVSFSGLIGLTDVLRQRTSIEPATPLGIDIEHDEIVFFPLIYWPILADSKPLSQQAIAKVDSFMKNGGTIFFDTQDSQSGLSAITGDASPATMTLRRILASLDIPSLEPVPPQHVLTRAFYLMQSFPGRWAGGDLWVEASEREGEAAAGNPDGVTSIIIGSNAYAAAWAKDISGRSLYPVVPGGERQRELAYRAGINVVMYALTGNYKADQVHVPALLERLGQ